MRRWGGWIEHRSRSRSIPCWPAWDCRGTQGSEGAKSELSQAKEMAKGETDHVGHVVHGHHGQEEDQHVEGTPTERFSVDQTVVLLLTVDHFRMFRITFRKGR